MGGKAPEGAWCPYCEKTVPVAPFYHTRRQFKPHDGTDGEPCYGSYTRVPNDHEDKDRWYARYIRGLPPPTSKQ